jgi:hypothetical protein
MRRLDKVSVLPLGSVARWLLACAIAAQSAIAGAVPARMRKVYDPKAPPLAAGPLLTGGGQGHLSQTQYDQLKFVATEVLRRFPPKDNYYIGIGRSPSAIISMFQNLTSDKVSPEEVAMNFPASGLHDGGQHDDASYFRHFDQLLPKEVVQGKRTIVLIDRSRPFQGNAASGGASLHVFKQILQRYLAHKGSQAQVEAVGFSYGQLNPAFGLKHIAFDMNTRPELERISMPYYEAVAEWPQHRIGPNVGIPQRRQEYTAYKTQMRERMMRDAQLDEFLDKNVRSELVSESPEEEKARVAEEKQAEQKKVADRLEKARAFKTVFTKKLGELVANLPLRADGHDKGPYLSENAVAMNDFLKEALDHQAEVNEALPSNERSGPNLVVREFMDRIEDARKEGKIRNRDYRRLMGHALSYAAMDEPMLKSLVARFESSKHFRREVTEESDYYLNSHASKAREETAQMAAHFQILQKRLPKLEGASTAQ